VELLLNTHGAGAPSAWVQRWSPRVAAGASVLDVACGAGRHLRWFAERGCRVTGVDRNAQAVSELHALGRVLVADIENGPWPFEGELFDAVVVTNYLWRPLLPTLRASVAEGGVLLYETFSAGHQTVGKPSNPDFLLRPGELLQAAAGLRVLGYEDGFLDAPPRFVQRIAALREGMPGAVPARHPL
jgi:SAM-dependent methyltransferase